MVFLCFSINDREHIVEQILYHLRSFGLDVWYDRKDIFLGDNRYQVNLEEGANGQNNNYSIVIMSKNFLKGDYCKKELNIIQHRFSEKKTHIFPIMYNISDAEIPNEFKWLLSLVCKFINPKQETIGTCYHIVSKITFDSLEEQKYKTLNEYLKLGNNKYVIELLSNYSNLDQNNFNAKMSLLYSLYLYIKNENDIFDVPPYYYRGFEKLYSFTRLNIETDIREMQIMENMSLLLLSTWY